jgi:hypothetical protein
MNKQLLAIGIFGLALFVDLFLWSVYWRNGLESTRVVPPQVQCNCNCSYPSSAITGLKDFSSFVNDITRYIPEKKTTSLSTSHFSFGVPIEDLTPYLRSPVWYNDPKKSKELVGDLSYIHFLPYYINITAFPRRIYIDLGVNKFETSIGWMFSHYPCKFDYVYGWEANMIYQNSAQPPADYIKKYGNIFDIQVGIWVDTKNYTDEKGNTHMDLAEFIKSHCSREDFVVMKMDVDGFEWDLLPHFLKKGTFDYIDEFFVEIHYAHPLMAKFNWDRFAPHTAEEARSLLTIIRKLGVYAHYWP